jgi:multidrug resistance protein, MATE family
MSTNLAIAELSPSARSAGGVREVARLASPVLVQMLSETLMQVASSAMVGRLGPSELGAVGLGGIWLWTLICPFVGAATGVSVFVSRAHGAGQPRECGPWVWRGLAALVPAAVLWTFAVAALFPILIAAIDPSPELTDHTLAYVLGRLPGLPAIAAGAAMTSFFRGLGNTRTPMAATIVTVLLQAVLAYALIFGRLGLPGYGVMGAGIAFAIAEWVYAGILFGFLLRRDMRTEFATLPSAPDPGQVRRFLRTSSPIGGQWLLDMLSFALFSSIVARMGDAEMAASQAMIQLLSLSFMQAVAISVSAGALVGRYLGAANPDAAARSYASAMKLAMVLAALVAALFLGAPELLMRVFSDDAHVLALARPLLVLGALFQAVDAIGIVAGGSLRGGGDTRWPFLVHATLAWAARLPLVWLLAVRLEGGVLGAWLGELGYIALLGLAFVLRFRSGQWKAMQP